MIIEFYTPHEEVTEQTIRFVKEKLMDFYHKDNEISGAEVSFRIQRGSEKANHICEISLAIYGELIMVHRRAKTYIQAARDVIDEISVKVDEFLRRQKEPPDEIISTVEV